MKEKSLPPEFFAIFLPSLGILLLTIAVNLVSSEPLPFTEIKQFLLLMLGTAKFFKVALVLIFCAVLFVLFASRKKIGMFSAGSKAMLGVLLLIFPVWVAFLASATNFMNVSPARVLASTRFVADLDLSIFGLLPSYGINLGIFELPALYSYWYLYVVLGVVITLLFLFSTSHFRKMFVAMAISLFTSIVGWFLLPTLAPQAFYIENVFKIDFQGIGSLYTNGQALAPYLSLFKEMWIDENGIWYAVSAFPSLHASWGIIAAYFGYRLYRPLALVLFPWLMMNLLGTFYTLQHYAIDIIAGILVAVISIFIAEKYFSKEHEFYSDISKITDVLKGMARNLKKYFSTTKRRILQSPK